METVLGEAEVAMIANLAGRRGGEERVSGL